MVDVIPEILDLRGLSCPEPVLRTKKQMDKPETEIVEVLVDDDVCVNNLQRLARSLKASWRVVDRGGYFAVVLSKGQSAATLNVEDHHDNALPSLEKTMTSSSTVGTVLFLGKDSLGEGEPDFSRTLMNVFLQTTFESGLRPRAILLMNTGVRLLAKNSQALKVLSDFHKAGCEVLACGLCVDFYGLKEDIAKEQITNMFAICEYLFAADKVIQP